MKRRLVQAHRRGLGWVWVDVAHIVTYEPTPAGVEITMTDGHEARIIMSWPAVRELLELEPLKWIDDMNRRRHAGGVVCTGPECPICTGGRAPDDDIPF